MEQPKPSKGPGPAVHGRPNQRPDFVRFAKAVVEADGEWVEMKIDAPTRGLHVSLLYQIARLTTEVRTRKGIAFGRMRKTSDPATWLARQGEHDE